MADSEIKVKCKQCGRMAPVDTFTLDPVFKVVVCAQCVKERKTKEKITQEVAAEKAAQQKFKEDKPKEVKPAGWDAEDEMLVKRHSDKMARTVDVVQVNSEKVQYNCPKCKYKFLFNIVTKSPKSCPYCNAAIMNLRLTQPNR